MIFFFLSERRIQFVSGCYTIAKYGDIFYTRVVKYSRYFKMNNSKKNPKRNLDKTNKHTK